VKVADALSNVGRLFLDTAPVIYYVERNPSFVPVVDDVFDRIDNGSIAAVTSPITLLECLVVPFRGGQTAVQQDFIDLIVRGNGVTFVPLDEWIARRGAELRAVYNLSLADAFPVAAALVSNCDAMLTNDGAIQRVKELTILVVGDLQV
jgi:predicted nucleic acid-binding protein